tara:strand:+ start:2935 stop:4497 length:1563 start_codon:yes stop_codon:yes gene_type:complete
MKDTSTYDGIVGMVVLFFLTYILSNENKDFMDNIFRWVGENVYFFRPRKNSVFIEGKRCVKVSRYMTKTDNLFSNRFTAYWYYISKNNLNNKTIYSVKEYANSSNIYDDYGDPKNNRRNKSREDLLEEDENNLINSDIFVVEQLKYFKIEDDIYCKVHRDYDKGDEKRKFEMENISIEIYSYTKSLEYLTKYLDNIYNNFRKDLVNKRNNKKFIYTLVGSGNNDSYYGDKEIKNEWEECEFVSSRNFNNLFFDDKKKLISKLNFFINNKDWYDYEGHPYTFGLGLHGPPGTGKTSIIKCIANKLNRHIIVIPLSKVKTQRDFNEYFFEQYYNRANSRKLNWENKIIVFEDIDCMSDIVKKRKTKDTKIVEDEELNKDKNILVQNKLLNKIAKKIDNEHVDNLVVDFDKSKDDNITLSYILNIIDGIRETPGRILIITSNNYESLDPALVRPGRIDMTLEMKNTSIDTIKEMYNHYYGDILPDNVEKKLVNNVISPAKFVNMRLEYERKEDFLYALINEFH